MFTAQWSSKENATKHNGKTILFSDGFAVVLYAIGWYTLLR